MDEFLSAELRAKYHMAEFDAFVARHGERDYYTTFLIQTDHIPAKTLEAQLLGGNVPEGYMDIIKLRQECRDRINKLDESEG